VRVVVTLDADVLQASVGDAIAREGQETLERDRTRADGREGQCRCPQCRRGDEGSMHRRRHIAVLAAAALVAVAFAPASAAPDDLDVVVLLDADHPGARGAARAVAAQHDVDPTHVYEHALDGFSGPVSPGRLRALENDPRVAVVEMDAEVAAASQTVPTGVRRVFADANPEIPTSGAGGAVDVDVAVLDTGIDASHPDLDVVSEVTCLRQVRGGNPATRGVCDPGGTDVKGHGTHVAGTIAALDNDTGVVGVAPGARLWSVKVLGDDGAGTTSAVVAGIDYVTANAGQIEVANMSLEGSRSRVMDAAISSSVAAGVVYVIAAGNQATDVSRVSPAGHPDALTVSALADFDGEPGGEAAALCMGRSVPFHDDTFASAFANYGDGVDLLAPGTCITSTAPGGDDDVDFGTSMAAPHVAGGAAILASQGMAVGAIHQTLLAEGNHDWDTSSYPGSPPPLLDVGNEEVFAPVLQGEGQEPVVAPSLTGESVRDGGSWRADVTVDAGPDREGAEAVLSYAPSRSEGGARTCEVGADGTCGVSVTLPNRDASVTFTLEAVGSEEGLAPVSLTLGR
jgi:subtilisin family serine protease